MKLRNKKTGKVVELQVHNIAGKSYETLADVNNDWEDYEDDDLSKIIECIDKGLEDELLPVTVNDFVEKLKAFKRLQDLGFRFEGVRFRNNHNYIEWKIKAKNELTDAEIEEFREDLHKVFGDENESKE